MEAYEVQDEKLIRSYALTSWKREEGRESERGRREGGQWETVRASK